MFTARRWAVGIGVLGCLIAAAPAAEPRPTEHWYVVKLQNQPSGWSMTRLSPAADRIVTESRMHIALRRSGIPMEISLDSQFVETPDGRPVTAVVTQRMGTATPTRREYRFADDAVLMKTITSSGEQTATLPPVEDDWLAPEATRRYIAERLAQGAKRIRYTTIDITSGLQPQIIDATVEGEQIIEVFGKRVPAIKQTVKVSSLGNSTATEYVDRRGTTLKTHLNMGMFTLELVLADEQLAKTQTSAPELLDQTFVTPSQPIGDPRRLRRARYTLILRNDDLPDLPDTAVQHVQRLDARSVRVDVDLDEPAEANGEAPKITASAMIDPTDQAVVDLKDRALRGAPRDATRRAEMMRQFVHRHIRAKDMSVGMATASETARTATGDCTEHAVLLAAMLRADDIAAQTVSGLIYVERGAMGAANVFGYHMWTQAWIDGRWVDLDATLGPETPYDAAHIALSTSTLDEGAVVNDLVRLVPMIGRLAIEVR